MFRPSLSCAATEAVDRAGLSPTIGKTMSLPPRQPREPEGDQAHDDHNGRRWLQCEIRAGEYDAKCRAAAMLADASKLDRVREQHLLSAAAWMQMAHLEKQLAEASIVRLAEVSTRRAANSDGQSREEALRCTA